jgi:hypothetical protein
LSVLPEEKNVSASDFDMNKNDLNFTSKLPAVTELINLKQKYKIETISNYKESRSSDQYSDSKPNEICTEFRAYYPIQKQRNSETRIYQ